jgi:hypothetical protein
MSASASRSVSAIAAASAPRPAASASTYCHTSARMSPARSRRLPSAASGMTERWCRSATPVFTWASEVSATTVPSTAGARQTRTTTFIRERSEPAGAGPS